ncbi:helicase C-terminal domain-containing protein [Streptomyces sp. NBC_01724]|uniref:helicase C-terminal domain-containing protein n=1 Tax=unclassified Streptomyces TaxID=2593676 RepID=UPI0028C45EBF|nr:MULTISPECIES: helicase C-terminal domain-containing protein [unclassified Streptomyces]WTE53235.1 helicase C-terminal domain-containing protein [Streptomyces sp. NBC_01620]WTE61337.1 helicase C-terminal domain-containing protein [Streptomyces sp. NBC_01617]WTI88752.1 helicase C-terminal domain-containing protein [Streptomyces sp. NBC_00724]WNO66325.1 helicase C-terminal domain-containing protein [Streptomyces sp. AM2-3-1]WSC70860.1 helicase C-terminal domain-containing protein [Streptomyces
MGMTTPPRTLAEALRARDDESLAGLLRARPDLLSPVPNDITQLATRAGTRASVVRALEHLDRFALQTAEALAVAPDPAPYETLLALLTGDGQDDGTARDDAGAAIRSAAPGALATLREQALVWGEDDRLRLVRTARELLAPSPQHPSPTGLGPTVAEATAGMSPGRLQEILTAAGLPATHDPVSAVASLSALFTDRTRMGELLDTAPVEALSVLDRLVWGPPYGEVTPNPTPPVKWLRDRGLLLPVSTRTVVLPREAALHLRAGRAHRVPEPMPPAVVAAATRDPQAVDSAAAGQAFLAVATVEELLTSWNGGGPPILRAGGLSVRELKRTAAVLDVSEPIATFWLELAYAAGLLASDGEADERYAPTPAYDDWTDLPVQDRWAHLATTWLAATRTAGLVGGQDAKGRALSALGPDLDRSAAPEVRHRVLALLASLDPGTAPDPETLLARLRWERPLRGASTSAGNTTDLRSRIALWTLNESELLGITGRGALSSQSRALLDSGPAKAAALLAPLIPEPLDHVLLQADLTAVAPGPLERPLADTLSVLADIESKGGATVYRFTPGSVRRALDAGQSAADLHAFLAAHSRTPVPQPLSYLIDDVARRHGHLRIGAASAYVRCDDEAVLNEILADRRSATLRLRRLAPTALAAQIDPASLLEGLREMGYAPAAESAEGDVLITRAGTRRTPLRTPPAPVPEGPPVPDGTLLGAAVRAIRAGDTAATVVHRETDGTAAATAGSLPRTTSAETLATVQAAAMTGSAVWIGYVNADGAASQRVIAPVRVEGGFVTAYDHTADEVRTYPLHRITGVAELADDATT